jgi:dTMP kinase
VQSSKVQQLKFPDRTSKSGQIINAYLAEGLAMNDNAMHLLFSANRWEKRCVPALCTRGHENLIDAGGQRMPQHPMVSQSRTSI